ncbi:MAG: hypothetical protein LUE27_05260 [Clostridia bacterium]|nr:hypothetical protein [Clostridia bacterium]
MKTKSLIISLAAGALLCACSSDELAISGSEQKVFEGDKAYVTVKISDVGSSTRATSADLDEDNFGPFEYGKSEQAVNDAHFYFYDDEGYFVSTGEVWEDGAASTDYDPIDNIEYTSGTVIILKGLTEKNYPKYVVTVLNKPDDFTAPETLEEMEEKLASDDEVGIQDGEGYFTMSTTSYFSDLSSPDFKHYFITELTKDDFKTEPVDLDMSDPVEIYVERLAVKVTLNVSNELAENVNDVTDTNGDPHTIYSLEETIAGDPNQADDDDISGEPIYVELLGWKLNATARQSYIMKNITDWTDNFLNFDVNWNDPTDHRSYWGMSYNYDKDDSEYPESADGNTPDDEESAATWLNKYLKYVNLEDTSDSPLLEIGASDYCAENTNTATNSEGTNKIIQHKNSSAITSILVKARICDENGDDYPTGEDGLTLVRYNGMLFTPAHFKEYILSILQEGSGLNY